MDAIFTEHCLECHASQDPEAKLVMESFDLLMKGGESGAVIVPGKSEESLLVRLIEGRVEKDGKKLIMPPGKKREKLKPEQIALIRAWIDAGAKPPAEFKPRELVVPRIEPKVPPRKSVNAIA
ncbi:MAG TPA: c-type cytochrome domain-containing protein, partial [Gemmatimonadaceae bacterium]|nr:c-type cytochrome domain-containing protein [Gemmatimonadaceae bacterium]